MRGYAPTTRGNLSRGESESEGSSEGWTYVVLESDFTTDQATAQVVTGLTFTPAENQYYAVQAMILVTSSVAGIAPRPGVSWPATVDEVGGGMILAPESTTAERSQADTQGTDFASGSATWTAAIDNAKLGLIDCNFKTSSPITADFEITLQAETAGNNVTMFLGSWLRYRVMG